MSFSKPVPSVVYDPAHPLGTNPGVIVGLITGSGVPTDDVTKTVGAYTLTNGGTTEPTWGVDAGGHMALNFLSNTTNQGTEKQLHFDGKGMLASEAASGVTMFAVFAPLPNPVSQSVPISIRTNKLGISVTNDYKMAVYIGASSFTTATPIPLTSNGNVWALIITFTSVSVANLYAKNLTTEGTPAFSTITFGDTLAGYLQESLPAPAIVNERNSGGWGMKGRLYMAGYAKEIWDSIKIEAFYADPWAAIRAAVAAGAGGIVPMIGSPFIRGTF